MGNRSYGRSSGNGAGRSARGGRYVSSSSGNGRSGAGRNGYNPDDIDRYNYVDRDIYSSAAAERRGGRPPRKGGCAKKFFGMLLAAALILTGAGLVYFHVMASRLNRSGGVDSGTLAKYVQQPAAAPSWDVKSDGDVMNILLLGVDENEDGSDGRSDSNILVSIDRKTKKLHLVSFLRDSYLEIPTVGKSKLNTAYARGGVALTMQTLENNYRVNIDKYVSVDFDNFAAVIDKMGGLDVPMSAAACVQENANMGTHLKPGVNHLSGKLCLYYARIRKASDDFGHDDYGRAGRQRQVIQLMVQKMKSMNPLESSKVMYDYLPYVKTNLSDSELLYLASIGAAVSGYPASSQQIPAPGTFNDQYKVRGIGYVIKLDLEKNCAILRSFLYGESTASAGAGE